MLGGVNRFANSRELPIGTPVVDPIAADAWRNNAGSCGRISSPWISSSQAILAVGLIVVGAALRLYGARGDLCFDEIWSLALLKPITSFGEIIWGINHDNNHVLNSMYLYMVGPDAAPVVLRGLSIVLGIASVVAAGLIFWRDGIAGALTAMLLFAISYPVVHYGSEARGYSGEIFFSLLSLWFLQREFSLPSWVNRQGLGLAIGLGLLSHALMVVCAIAFGIWTVFILWRRTADLHKGMVESFFILLPALVWSIAVAASVGFVALRHGFAVNVTHSVPDKFAIGMVIPFDFNGFINAYGTLVRLTVGLPNVVPAAACLFLAGGVAVASVRLWREQDNCRLSLYVVSIVILPAAALVAKLPNTIFSRYFLFSGTMFLLFIADVVNLAWLKGKMVRPVAAVILTVIVTGNAVSLFYFFSGGERGQYSLAVRRMAENGRIIYSTDYLFSMVVEFYSHKLGILTDYVREENWCTDTPDWYVDPKFNPNQKLLALPDDITKTLPNCKLRLTRADTFPYWGLSGRQLGLYRIRRAE